MTRTAIALCLGLAAFPAFAENAQPKMQEYLETEIATWSDHALLIEAIRAQNEETAEYSQLQIDAMDKTWRAEVGLASRPTIDPVLNNEASEYLRSVVAEAGGVITEVFVMDARGLNVAASDVTSDYWQGDEAKFRETYPVGGDAVHFGEIEFDDSTQSYQGQISFSITDPSTNEVVGAMTVGVNAETFF